MSKQYIAMITDGNSKLYGPVHSVVCDTCKTKRTIEEFATLKNAGWCCCIGQTCPNCGKRFPDAMFFEIKEN